MCCFCLALVGGWGQENTHFSQKHTLVITKRDKRLGSKPRDIICFVLVRLQGHNYENWPKSISRGPESVFFGITSRSLCGNITRVSQFCVTSEWIAWHGTFTISLRGTKRSTDSFRRVHLKSKPLRTSVLNYTHTHTHGRERARTHTHAYLIYWWITHRFCRFRGFWPCTQCMYESPI